MEISDETIKQIEHALWASQEHANLHNGDNNNIYSLCYQARKALFLEMETVEGLVEDSEPTWKLSSGT